MYRQMTDLNYSKKTLTIQLFSANYRYTQLVERSWWSGIGKKKQKLTQRPSVYRQIHDPSPPERMEGGSVIYIPPQRTSMQRPSQIYGSILHYTDVYSWPRLVLYLIISFFIFLFLFCKRFQRFMFVEDDRGTNRHTDGLDKWRYRLTKVTQIGGNIWELIAMDEYRITR